jgi:hypothetical protein
MTLKKTDDYPLFAQPFHLIINFAFDRASFSINGRLAF